MAGFRVLKDVDPRAIRLLARAGLWLCLPAGAELERVGITDRGLLFVMSGTMRVAVDDGRGGTETIALVRTGETLGEMSLLTEEPHSARLFAHRDSEILALDRDTFERIFQHHPQLMRNLSVLLIERLRKTTRKVAAARACRAVAFVARSDEVDLRGFVDRLMTSLTQLGVRAVRIDRGDAWRSSEWYHALEADSDVLVNVAGPGDDAWARQAERRSDRILLVTGAGSPDASAPDVRGYSGRAVDRVVLSERLPVMHAEPTGLRHLVRPGSASDIARLGRIIAGRAVGLVLSGGGARGFAHLGVIRALRESGFPIDMVGGTSMGAIVAAGLATEWPCDELEHRMREAFVTNNPISDITLPTTAFFGGRKVRGLLERNFGTRRIEELAIPFVCVTSDLTRGTDASHVIGSVAERLRASVALPGLLPPVVIDGRVHVDGGVMNNLPVEQVAKLGAETVIAVDVSGDTSLLPGVGAVAPGILSILVRVGTVGNEWQRREARRRASFLIDPPVDGVGFRDWQSFDRVVSAAYYHTRDVLDGAAGRRLRAI